MKIQPIMNLMKKSNIIQIYRDENRSAQWIGNGDAFYAIHCLPQLDEDQLCAIIGIPEDKKSNYKINVNSEWFSYLDEEIQGREEQIDGAAQMSLRCYGKTFLLFSASAEERSIFINEEYLKPIKALCGKNDTIYYYYRRLAGHSIPVLAVKIGMILAAVIAPVAMCGEESFIKDFTSLYKCVFAQNDRYRDLVGGTEK